MLSRDVTDQFLNQYCFTNAGTTEKTDLTTLCIRLDKVDYLNTGEKNFSFSSQIFVGRRHTVDWVATLFAYFNIDTVNGIAGYVKQTALNAFAYRHCNRLTKIHSAHTTAKAIGRVHRYCSN